MVCKSWMCSPYVQWWKQLQFLKETDCEKVKKGKVPFCSPCVIGNAEEMDGQNNRQKKVMGGKDFFLHFSS